MNAKQRNTSKGRRAESAVQVLILLTIGGTAAAASFTHVHDVAAAHGQPGWLAWADAVVLELMSVAGGLELRRRKRVGARLWFPAVVLAATGGVALGAAGGGGGAAVIRRGAAGR